jgi:hypothetical protein
VLRVEHLGQRLALDQLHHEVDVAGVLAERVDLHQVGVVEDASIAASARNRVTSSASLARSERSTLIATWRAEAEIFAAVDHAHRAARQLVEDAVGAAQRRAGGDPGGDVDLGAGLGLAARRRAGHDDRAGRGAADRGPQPREPGLAGALAGAEQA